MGCVCKGNYLSVQTQNLHPKRSILISNTKGKTMQGPFFYPVAQLLMLKPLGVQATSERVVVAVYVVDVDVVVIQ